MSNGPIIGITSVFVETHPADADGLMLLPDDTVVPMAEVGVAPAGALIQVDLGDGSKPSTDRPAA